MEDGFVNSEGALHCNICGATFKVYDLEERSVDFCPFCNARSDNFETIDTDKEH